jgi:hypothetical protein
MKDVEVTDLATVYGIIPEFGLRRSINQQKVPVVNIAHTNENTTPRPSKYIAEHSALNSGVRHHIRQMQMPLRAV